MEFLQVLYNVCSTEKDTKRSSNKLLRLVSFSAEQMLFLLEVRSMI